VKINQADRSKNVNKVRQNVSIEFKLTNKVIAHQTNGVSVNTFVFQFFVFKIFCFIFESINVQGAKPQKCC